jgi:hypothetical protein
MAPRLPHPPLCLSNKARRSPQLSQIPCVPRSARPYPRPRSSLNHTCRPPIPFSFHHCISASVPGLCHISPCACQTRPATPPTAALAITTNHTCLSPNLPPSITKPPTQRLACRSPPCACRVRPANPPNTGRATRPPTHAHQPLHHHITHATQPISHSASPNLKLRSGLPQAPRACQTRRAAPSGIGHATRPLTPFFHQRTIRVPLPISSPLSSPNLQFGVWLAAGPLVLVKQGP